MKTKTVTIAAIVILLTFQSSFGWRVDTEFKDGFWITLQIPTTSISIPIYFSENPYQFERVSDIPDASYEKKPIRFRRFKR
jgi:hypothetical protein